MERQSGCSCFRNHIHAAAAFVEGDAAIGQREEGPIAAGANVFTGNELRTALANKDAASGHELAAVFFDAEAFADAVAAVTDTTFTFFMCHKSGKLSVNLFDLNHRQFLAVTGFLVITFAALHLEADDLIAALMFHNVSHNRRSCDSRGANIDFAIVIDEENTVESESLACLDRKTFDFQGVACGDTVLFAASF